MTDPRHFYIDGRWVAPAVPRDLAVIDPSTEEAFATISLGGQADTDAAVAAARAAFDGWAYGTEPAERLALVERIATIYKARAEDLAQAMSREMGAPIAYARRNQVGAGAWHISNFIKVAQDYAFIRPLGPQAPNDRILMDAAGVCALITPWNWPMNQITLKVIPALLAGCTMVLKPSEIAPMSAIVFAEILDEAGTPPGVFNMVHGDGEGVGTLLSTHPEVDLVSFTGSPRAGRLIMRNAADTLKRVHLELGGKGANIVFADARDGAVAHGTRYCFNNAGQSCNAPTRMLVERAIYDEAVEIARATAEATGVAPASEDGRHIGPVVSAAQFERVQQMIQTGIDEGARLIAGGIGRPEGLNRGFFVRPTVFADVRNDMAIAQQEIFGPVLSIIPFDDEDEAIAIANDTPYGLTNYVETASPDRRIKLARRLRSGMVEMNGNDLGACSPFGGMKASGNGREGGVWGLEEYLEVKAVSDWPEGA